MPAVVVVRNADGLLGRCDASCYNGTRHERCKCICDGVNHGVGRLQAMASADELAASWGDRRAHVVADVHPEAAQVLLPFGDKS